MTGAELRAWRERLGKDEAWARGVLEGVNVPGLGHGRGYGDCRILVERDGLDGYADNQRRLLRAALVAALEDEERAQAKRGPVEPVCPEGVTRGDMLDPDDGSPNMMGDLGLGWQVHVSDSGRIRLVDSGSASPALLEYAAALSRYRAALHAASDEQRKLDAVRATEEAHRKAWAEYDRATLEYNAAARALLDARREAGL
jgi:hypothetical protein